MGIKWKKPKWVQDTQTTLQKGADKVGDVVRPAVQQVVQAVTPPPIPKPPVIERIQTVAQKAVEAPAKANPISNIGDAIKNAAYKAGDAIAAAPNAIERVVNKAGDAIAKNTGLDKSPITIKPLTDQLKEAPKNIVHGVGDMVAAPFEGNGVDGFNKTMKGVLSPLTGTAKSVADSIIQTGDAAAKMGGWDKKTKTIELPMPAKKKETEKPVEQAKAEQQKQPTDPREAFPPEVGKNWVDYNKATAAYEQAKLGKITWEEYERQIQELKNRPK
jgi:hypothetical protein